MASGNWTVSKMYLTVHMYSTCTCTSILSTLAQYWFTHLSESLTTSLSIDFTSPPMELLCRLVAIIIINSHYYCYDACRYSLPQTTGKGKAKEEEPVLSHHAVAYLNLAPLLYPGGVYSLLVLYILIWNNVYMYKIPYTGACTYIICMPMVVLYGKRSYTMYIRVGHHDVVVSLFIHVCIFSWKKCHLWRKTNFKFTVTFGSPHYALNHDIVC